MKRTEIQNGTPVNFGATVMGGAVIEPETTLLPLSLVLKEMHLPTATYEGSPAEPVGGTLHSNPSITEPRPGPGYSELSREMTSVSNRSGGAAAAT